MANYNNLKQGIQAVIRENHNNEITGNLLQQALLAMINSLGVGYQFIDVATTATNPGSPDQRSFYIAEGPGNYPNFNAEVFPGEIAIFEYSTTWLKKSVQVADLKNIGFVGTFQSGIALDPSDGEEIVDTTYDASDYIPVEKGSVVIYSGGETDSNRAAIVGYDEDKYMVDVLLAGGSDWLNKIVAITDHDIKYVRVSSCNSTHPDYGNPFAFNIVRTTDLLIEIDGLKNDVASLGASVDAFAPVIQLVRDGYIYQGIAIPGRTYPDPDDLQTFYWIEDAGTYPGGVLGANQVGLLRWTGADWTIDVLNVAKASSLATTNTNLSNMTTIVQNILSVVAAGYEFIGVATPSQVFPADTYKYNVMYLAFTPGTYTNLGNFQIAADEVALLMWNAQSEEWSKQTLDIAKKTTLDALATEVGLLGENKADKASSNPAMLVGSALGIMGNTPQAALFTHRAVPAGAGSGAAQMRLLRGRSIVWNQLVTNGDFAAGTTGWNSPVSMTVADGIATVAPGIIFQSIITPGHKYLITAKVKPNTSVDNPQLRITYRTSGGSGLGNTYVTTTKNQWNNIAVVKEAEATAVQFTIGYYDVLEGGDTWNITDVNVIDLTQLTMPDLTAPAFEALYPGFHGYNAGTIKNLMATGIKTVGFNQWDEEIEVGQISQTDGQNTSGTAAMRAVNYTRVTPGVTYYLCVKSISIVSSMRLFYYGAAKEYIGTESVSINATTSIPANCHYIRFQMATSVYGTTYKNDICINISGPRNGQYEPYRSYTMPLPITTMTGKAGGTGDSVTIYHDGMMAAGTAFDNGRVDADGWWRRTQVVMKMVNLGDYNYTYNSEYGFFFIAQPDDIKQSTENRLCGSYIYGGYRSINAMGDAPNMTMYRFNDLIFFKNTAYTDPDSFKTAMNGVYLIYELATPVEYVLDTPIYMGYPVDADGTETMQPDQTGLSEPSSAPIDYDVLYPIDAAGNLVTALNAMLTANSLSGSFAEDGNGWVKYNS